MNTSNYVLFNDGSDVAYVNSTSNFRGADIGASQEIDIFFESASSQSSNGAYDKVRLHVKTNGDEVKALEAVASAMAGAAKEVCRVMADDDAKVYFSEYFDAVTSITSVNNLNATNAVLTTPTLTTPSLTENVLVKTDDYSITAADSGSTIVMNDTDAVFTLPTCAAGLNYKIILAQDTVAGSKIAAGASDHFFGSVTVTTTTAFSASDSNVAAQSVPLATTSLDEVAFTHDSTTLGGKAGDVVYITGITDAAWCVDANLLTDGASPASIAVIV
tara:strand:- start:51 stop:872 length:822 start_codon:yes stop_codon:yes gene_type:complete